jgi:hypothetical protein
MYNDLLSGNNYMKLELYLNMEDPTNIDYK